MSDVKRYWGRNDDMPEVGDKPPVDIEWGTHSVYVEATDYDAKCREVERLLAVIRQAECMACEEEGCDAARILREVLYPEIDLAALVAGEEKPCPECGMGNPVHRLNCTQRAAAKPATPEKEGGE